MSTLTVEQVRNMALSECMAESKTRYQQAAEIEQRHPNGVTPEHADDYAQIKTLLTEVDLIETRTAELEDAGNRRERILDNNKRFSKPASGHTQPDGDGYDAPKSVQMFGHQFVDSREYKAQVESGEIMSRGTKFNVDLKGGLLSFLARKALVYSASGSGGNLIQNQILPGYMEILQRQLTLLDLIPTGSTASNTIEYIKEKTFTNAAATVAEATATTGTSGLKPESVIAFEETTVPVRTIAHWVPVTNAMLADAPQIRGIIENRLIYGLNQELEDQVLSGDGNAPNMTGILASGLSTIGLAAGSTYGGAANAVDAAYAAMLICSVTGLARPNGFVFNPLDWAAVRLSRESAVTGNVNPGGYLWGAPSMAGPDTLWGRPVVLSLGMTENTILTGDFQLGCQLFDREQAAIKVGTIDDQFVRNMQTILAELRAAFAVFRPTAFCRVTGA